MHKIREQDAQMLLYLQTRCTRTCSAREDPFVVQKAMPFEAQHRAQADSKASKLPEVPGLHGSLFYRETCQSSFAGSSATRLTWPPPTIWPAAGLPPSVPLWPFSPARRRTSAYSPSAHHRGSLSVCWDGLAQRSSYKRKPRLSIELKEPA